ncbi:hypothetical protein I4F81_000954 [Pyropia yezoensis]|uniref:Uncharacterized protein n=2 Tax=Pyropia yezoensis TaxID=2788 RepID=A0ACC3BK65_PYRYE|nr:hypothetical protein I4F81_000954 [Neopyropia yezoensis]KAK1858346.1 hypothetical protein I4F81_000954 [Neopyropia yezoensis]
MAARRMLVAAAAASVAALALTAGTAQAAAASRDRPAAGDAAKPLTSDFGTPVGDNVNTLSVGPRGPQLVQDTRAFEKLARFNRERIPERVVHARGTGAHGVFESYGDLSDLTRAGFLGGAGRKTEVFVRFSTVIHSKGSPETLRDPRGFAVKFKIAEKYGGGVWDLVGNNLDVFFIRDQVSFPDMVHSLKPDPVTNIQDPNRFFDFFGALGGAATNMLTTLYSDLGTPATLREMNGHSVHAYKLVSAERKVTYVKFEWTSQQGIKNFTAAEAMGMQGKDFNHATRDLYNSINDGKFPSWELRMQVVPSDRMDKLAFDPLDATKRWPESVAPFKAIGKMTLNRVPDNFFQTTESVAMSPGTFLPGAIEPSEDKLLQGRLVSYPDTQRYRLGANYADLPINRPLSPVRAYTQDGAGNNGAMTGTLNYGLSLTHPVFPTVDAARFSESKVCDVVTQAPIPITADFAQAGELYESFSPRDQENLVANLAGDLGQVRSDLVRNTMCSHFYKANEDFGRRVVEAVKCNMRTVQTMASHLDDGISDDRRY